MNLIILGYGGYGRTVQDIAEQSGCFDRISFLDDKVDTSDSAIIGLCLDYTKYIDADTRFIVAIGNSEARMKWIDEIQEFGGELATLIHSSAYVSPKAVIGAGSVILPGAIVNTGVILHRGVIVNIGAIVDHDTILEDGVHLAPGAIVKGENRIQRMTKIDSGTVVAARSMT